MDEKAEQLAQIAMELMVKVRDEAPEVVHRWLASVIDPADWMGLAIVLACAVPDDRSWKELTAWTWTRHMRPSRSLQPCGTIAALRRHQAHGEAACDDCKAADRERKRENRKAKADRESTGFPLDSHPNSADGVVVVTGSRHGRAAA